MSIVNQILNFNSGTSKFAKKGNYDFEKATGLFSRLPIKEKTTPIRLEDLKVDIEDHEPIVETDRLPEGFYIQV